MQVLTRSLWQFVRELQPSAQEIESVKKSAFFLVSMIGSKSKEGLIPTAQEFHFIGSVARGTKPSPINDVDLLYVVGEAQKVGDHWHSITLNTFPYAVGDYEPDGNLSSVLLLNRIKKALLGSYPCSDLRRNHEVVNVYLSSYDLSFDLVPAWKIVGQDYYLIPQGRQQHKWKKTNPFGDQRILDSLNQKTNSTLKATVLLLKYWFRKRQTVTPRSYHLEATVYYILTDFPRNTRDLRDTLTVILHNLGYKGLLRSCADPTGLSAELSSGLSDQDFDKMVAYGKESAALLYKQGEEAFLATVDDRRFD